jgi:seryl-tRNA synthetase
MIDIRLVRSDPETVKRALGRRGIPPSEVDALAELDRETLAAERRRDDLRSRLKALSREVNEARRRGDKDQEQLLRERARVEREAAEVAEAKASELADRRREMLLGLPNLPSPEAPDGRGAEDNVVRSHWVPEGHKGYAPHQRMPHWEVGKQLGILDLERGAKLSGSMFPLFRGAGARLIRALTNFALDQHTQVYEEIRPPTLVRTATMVSTGHLPKFADEAYHLERDDLWAIPTAEVPLTSMGRDEIFLEDELPLRMTAATSCFRREAGAAGRETRGLLRVHEFDKVEILAYATPEQAPQVHEEMLSRAESLIRQLNMEYRVVDLCAGDLGASAARTFDLEVYAPGCDQWLEVSSVSWFSDYQARRANIRYRSASTGNIALVHTLNGSALAWPRIWAALVEVNRLPDGSVRVPECLLPWMGGCERITQR